jgi:hypothetical protein
MKTPISSAWIPGLLLALAWLPAGFARNDNDLQSLDSPRSSAKQTVAMNSVTLSNDLPRVFPALPRVVSESPAVVSQRQPPRMRLSPWTSEVVKLAESGIEEHVILSFIENSGTFNLGAEQIIYLNDLGLSGVIVAAMLRHDQEIISGLKPLTITSQPDWELPFDLAAKPGGAVVPKPASAPLAKLASARAPVARPSHAALVEQGAVDHLVMTPPFTATQPASREEATTGTMGGVPPRPLAGQKESVYRVRQPFPEEITAPIIIVGGGRTPNTLIVVGFPQETR